jgi:hypothetical protein
LLTATFLLAYWIAHAARSDDGPGPRGSATAEGEPPGPEAAPTLREGTKLIDVAGAFRNTGDRIEFRPVDSEQRLVVLENLALQRVASMLADVRRQRPWTVSGTITEFRGVNYLLVTRAVLQSHHAPANNGPAGLSAAARGDGGNRRGDSLPPLAVDR